MIEFNRKNTKSYQTENLIAAPIDPKSKIPNQNGGDDRIRTCEGLLTLNDLANRRFQPLSHVSARQKNAIFILAFAETLSSLMKDSDEDWLEGVGCDNQPLAWRIT